MAAAPGIELPNHVTELFRPVSGALRSTPATRITSCWVGWGMRTEVQHLVRTAASIHPATVAKPGAATAESLPATTGVIQSCSARLNLGSSLQRSPQTVRQ